MKIKKIATIAAFFMLSASLHAQDTITLYFANNSCQLSPQDENSLMQLVTKINGRQIENSITIVGYADFVGKRLSNQQLSENRSKSAETFLIKNGVKPQEIKTTIGMGSTCCNPDHKKEGGCQNHRRTDVIFHKKESISKIQQPDTTVQKPIIKEELVEDISESILNTEVGETLLLDHINFVGGSDVWLEESIPSIEKLLDVLLENPTIKIQIQGHICCSNTDESNLSTRRALAIYKYLVDHGIDKKRLEYKGYGRTRPLINNPDETKNRRVEILIMEK